MNGIAREFDELADVYENNRLAPWYQAHEDLILEDWCFEGSENPMDVLDVGCASGHLLRQFLASRTTSRGLGLDVSPKMVAAARQHAANDTLRNLEFMVGDWETIDLRQLSQFDFKVIFCANTFHYFSNPRRAAARLFEVLGDNGTLYILERDKTRSLLTVFWEFLHHNVIKDHVTFYSRHELTEFLEAAGFNDIQTVRTVKRYFWKGKLFTAITLIKCHKNSK